MTLFMLLVAICGFSPISAGIGEGKKYGLIGIIIGIVIGAIIGSGAVAGALATSRYIFFKYVNNARPHIASVLAALLYFLLIVWAFVATGITMAAMKLVPWK
jgi:hypothetical protein